MCVLVTSVNIAWPLQFTVIHIGSWSKMWEEKYTMLTTGILFLNVQILSKK